MLPDTLQAASQLIPQNLGLDSAKKELFIRWRICGFTTDEAVSRSGISRGRVDAWFKDPEFAELMAQILDKQEELYAIILRKEEMKSRIRMAEIDGRVLDEAMDNGVDQLKENSFDYLKGIRKGLEVTPQDRISIGIGLSDSAPRTVTDMIAAVKVSHGLQEKNGPEESKVIEGKSQPAEHQESTTGPARLPARTE